MAPSYQMATEWLSIPQVATELGMDEKRVREWTKRRIDPLPTHLIAGNRKQGRVFRPELNEWIMRNSELLQPAA